MTTHNALIIPANPDEPTRVETIDTALESLQGLIEGLIEPVSYRDWAGWFNEEAITLGLPVNRRATRLVFEASGIITQAYFGSAVFLGETEDGEHTDVPAALLAVAETCFPVTTATAADASAA